MKTKADIVANWLPRYTGTPRKDFGMACLSIFEWEGRALLPA